MDPEKAQVPLTYNSVKAIADIAGRVPKQPVVVPISYGSVTVPAELPACITGVLNDPHAYMLNDFNVPLGPSRLTPDEDGQITDGIFTGITAEALLQGIPELTTILWTLHLNLASPAMPAKYRKFLRARPGIGLVAIVTPDLVSTYLRSFADLDPVAVYPHPSGTTYFRTRDSSYHEYIDP